jgi:CheB methylesterase
MQENRAYSLDKAISSQQNPPTTFPVVAMAVPAGDAKAMAMLSDCKALPSDLAVIMFEYGQPREDVLKGHHDGSLAVQLRKTMNVQVQLAGEGMAVEKGKIFIVPAGVGIQISEGRFVFSPTISPGTEPYLPDLLLARLAYSWGDRVIAVLISDQTSSGFTGCRVVREEGGFAFLLADSQRSGDGSGAAEASGCIDGQFPPAQLAPRLLSLVDYPVFAERLKKNIAADKANLGVDAIVFCGPSRHDEVGFREAKTGVRRNDIDIVRFDGHAVGDLPDLHLCLSFQQFRQDAIVVGRQVQYDDESGPCIDGQVFQQLKDCLQSACGGTDSYQRK